MIFKLHSGHEDAANVESWLNQFKDIPVIKTQKRIEYLNIPSAFDIETTSFIDSDGHKRGVMYVWQMGINGAVIMGRTWDEFVSVLQSISRRFHLSQSRRLIMYVHFLSFEFQWMRKWLDWSDVFSTDIRQPLYAVTTIGIEFRCSFMLSGYALATLGEQLTKYKVKKLEDFDYSKIRHCKTPLTPDEYAYCEHDVLVVMAYVQEEMEREGNIAVLPLTKTGYVRKHCRRACLYDSDHKTPNSKAKYANYHGLIKSLTMDVDEYWQLRRAFQGGFTHANARFSGRTLTDVDSWDFTSSYPYVMCVNRFPMSKGVSVAVDKDSFRYYLKRYACLFDIQFTGLEPKCWEENYLSASKCWDSQNVLENNGRVVTADMIRTTLTDVDFSIVEKFYKWKSIRIANFRIYTRDYLPTPLVLAILDLYRQKTELKDVIGMEAQYQNRKGMTNSTYGMAVTNPVMEKTGYNPESQCWQVKSAAEWRLSELDLEEAPESESIAELLDKYNRKKDRFLFYPWGVWTTAYARKNLLEAIYAFGDDYIYSDTDSLKAINGKDHYAYIDSYNAHVHDMIRRAAKHHNIPLEYFSPKTIKGETKTLGVWDHETSLEKGGPYVRFKTIGAKRYMLEKRVNPNKAPQHPDCMPMGETPLEISLTVSGLNKRLAIPYMLGQFGADGIFDAFTNKLEIPAGHTGRTDPVIIDKPTHGSLIDYTGIVCEYNERSSIYMENRAYNLDLAQQYIDYLKGFREYVK